MQNPRALTYLGVSVGPDGNIYSVGTQGMGVFSLTPAGTLRWTNPELYQRPIVDYAEIVFGPNGSNQQLYFSANAHMRAVGLDGSSVFTVTRGQPAVAPDGSVHNTFIVLRPEWQPELDVRSRITRTTSPRRPTSAATGLITSCKTRSSSSR